MYKQCKQLIDSHFPWKVNRLKMNCDKRGKSYLASINGSEQKL